jgi:hypothetical protein
MPSRTPNQSPRQVSAYKVGDRVRFQLGPRDLIGVIVEDRGFLGSGGRHLFRVKVDFDPPNVSFIELPEEELSAA